MTRFPHHEQDYAFGQRILTLRTAIGLTQAGLAEYLGVSRRAIGDWEAGNSHPKAEHLKKFIALAVENGTFPVGHEAEEVRALWKTARQKVLLDEPWLASLLQHDLQQQPPGQPTQPVQGGPADQEMINRFLASPAQAIPSALTITGKPRIDSSDAPDVRSFYGRKWELEMLSQWVVEEHCQVVSVLGLGGIGKSVLSARLMHRVAPHFEVVIWRSVRDAPECKVLLDEYLQVLSPDALIESSPVTLDQHINLLVKHLRSTRTLLVLDNLESLLDEGQRTGRLRAGYESYGKLLRRIAETEHQSCVLITSREKPEVLVPMEGSNTAVRVLRLARLSTAACEQLLEEKGVEVTASDRAQLIDHYAGNPLALKIVAQTIVDLFRSDIASFLLQGETIYGGIRDLLAEQFNRLSSVQQNMMFWLAIVRRPCTLDELQLLFAVPISRVQLLEGVEALHRRSLIEVGTSYASYGSHLPKHSGFTLQSVVLEYVTERLISEASSEIESGNLACLVEHSFALAQAPEYVRQTQERLIVSPVLAHLQGIYFKQGGVEERLLALVDDLRTRATTAQGYGPANLVALLAQQRGNLCGLDLSKLVLRNVYFQGVEMQDASLVGATVNNCTFMEAFGAIISVGTESSGRYWAVCSEIGEVWVWKLDSHIPQRVWQTNTNTIWRLSFSPDGGTLVGGGWDGMVMLWEATEGKLLWSSELDESSNFIFGLAFAPDGRTIASGGKDGILRLWDTATGRATQILQHPGDVLAVAWSPDVLTAGQHLLASGDREGTIRLWRVSRHESPICILALAAHSQMVTGLAFSPDGSTLASSSWDGTVKLWEVPTGRLLETLTGHTNRVQSVAWSQDGATLASGGYDKTVWLWDVEKGAYRAALRGHTSVVRGLAFMLNSAAGPGSLLSGSDDGSLREWDPTTGQSIRVLSGYAVSLNEIDWSPDGTQLVGASSDSLLTIFDPGGARAPRLLHGHTAVARAVAWSPNGQWLASTQADNTIRLWNTASGECIYTLHDTHDTSNDFSNVAWSPDGKWLASGTNKHGIRVFDVATHQPRWQNDVETTGISSTITWSPDGNRLAGGSYDGVVYVWDASDGRLLQQLSGHSNVVITVSWSPDGTRIASSSVGVAGDELMVWDAEKWESQHAVINPRCALAWSRNGDWLICDSDGELCWWDVQRWECIRVLKTDHRSIVGIRTSPDGTMVATCGDEGAIMVWDLLTGQYLRTLRRDRPYERLNIAGIKGVTDAQKAMLKALGAVEV